MAAYILRLGRLGSFKCLQLESWGILRSQAFCSKSGEPEIPVKKTKASSKTEAPNERAALLTYKTTVAFPIRLSEPGFFSAQSVGEAEPVVSSTAVENIVATEAPTTFASEPAVAEPEAAAPTSDPVPDQDVAEVIADAAIHAVDIAPQTVDPLAKKSRKGSVLDDTPVTGAAKDDTVPASVAFSEPGDAPADLSSSSSSSDSDSDSDSDTEGEKSHVKTETIISQPVVEEPTVKKEAHIYEVTDVMKDTNEAQREPETAPTSGVESVQKSTAPSEAAKDVPQVTSPEDAAPEIDDAPPAVPPAQGQSPEIGQTDTLIKTTEADEKWKEPSEPVCAEEASEAKHESVGNALDPREPHTPAVETLMEDSPVEATPEPVETETSSEVTAATIHAESAEELVDAAPVIAEAGGENLQIEAPVDQPEEAAVMTPPEPEEPFDNSTYKNYQHHSYNPYTFADMDVEMAKFRLVQPSSGRPSPRH